MAKIEMITKTGTEDENFSKRESAQVLGRATFEKITELVQRNVTKAASRTYTQYAKDTVRTYLQSPATNIDNIREVSRFLERNSTLYKKMLTYYAATPLFYYNLIETSDPTKSLNANKIIKNFYNVSRHMHNFKIKNDMFNATYNTVRDGMYVGFQYGDENGSFLMPLDIKYCRIYGKNEAGQWITYFNASFFEQSGNDIFVNGVNGDTTGCWDQVFIDGYNAYQTDKRNAQWFRLPPERTLTLIAGSDDQHDVPLPLLTGIFVSLMDIADLESIMASKTELENYKLLVGKIPLLDDGDVDDFAISWDLVQQMQALLNAVVPELVGVATLPFDVDTVDFSKSNSTQDTDKLGESIQNLFNNAGVSQIVVAGGTSSNSIGLKHALQNDMSNIWIYVNKIESWLNYHIKNVISDGYELQIHPISWYNREEYQTSMKDILSFGGSLMAYLTSCGDTPFEAYQKLHFENTIGIKSLMRPLVTSYTSTASDTQEGAPEKDVDDLSEEGLKTKDGNKNGNE